MLKNFVQHGTHLGKMDAHMSTVTWGRAAFIYIIAQIVEIRDFQAGAIRPYIVGTKAIILQIKMLLTILPMLLLTLVLHPLLRQLLLVSNYWFLHLHHSLIIYLKQTLL